jgi:hypothetical protein
MKEGPLGIFYFDYADVPYPVSKRKMIIGYTRQDLLDKIDDANIPNDWLCWLKECRTPKQLISGNPIQVRDWIDKHLSDKYGEPWKT